MIGLEQASLEVDLDVSALQEMCDGDREFEGELLETFLACQESAIADLADAMRNKDFDALKKIAHFTKGGARSVGATRLASAAEALESAMTRGDHSSADKLTSEIQVAYGNLKTIIAKRLAN